MKNYTQAELVCSELRVAFVNAMKLMRRLNPAGMKGKRSTSVLADKHLQRFCNELRNLAAEADQPQ